MAEHKVKKGNLYYIIPSDELFQRYICGELYIDDYSMLKDNKTGRIVGNLKHVEDDAFLSDFNQLYNLEELKTSDSCMRNMLKEALAVYGIYNAIKKTMQFCNQKREKLLTSEYKSDIILRECKKRKEHSIKRATKNNDISAEEAESELKKLMYYWFKILESMKKLDNANFIDINSVRKLLMDEYLLSDINELLEKNPNQLDNDEILTLNDVFGRDLYIDEKLIPVKMEEVIPIIENYNQN